MPTIADLRPITLGVSSCQAREGGAWAAHRDLASADVDVVVWLGDYIYGEHRTLDEYRSSYAAYRGDPLLQACHAAHPWIVFTDDHEVTNDYDASVDPSRRAAAYRAWWENQPTRLPPPDDDGRLQLHRSFDLGGSVHLVGLDVRQHASDSGLLGEDQWQDLESESAAPARNTVVASPVLMSGIRDLEGEPLLPYTIDSRPSERERFARLLSTMPSPVIVSGDLHTSLVADFSADPLDRTAPVVAPEIMAPAISSAFPARFAPLAPFLPLVNPQLRQVEVANGWLELTLSSDQAPSATFHFVDDINDPESPITLRPITV
jgi:alkaline phosphatase D